jgi:transposase
LLFAGSSDGSGDLTDEEWNVIGGLLPSECGRKSGPSHDNRRFLDGMLHVVRVGCPWRDMHERYGRWNSIYVRFRRWAEQGVWDALLQTLVDFGRTDDWRHMIDSTTVHGHVSAAGAKGGLIRKLLVDHAAALRARSTPRCDNQGRPLGFILTIGETSDYKAIDALMAFPVAKPKALLADKGYDGGTVRANLLMRGILPIIPPKSDLREPVECDLRRYRNRNRIERMFGYLKHQPRIATRYDKSTLSFLSFLDLAAIRSR